MKFLTPEVSISVFLFSAVLFFMFSTSLPLVYCQIFPQHAQHLYFIKGYSRISYMCCSINTLMVKSHSPVVSEMDSFLPLRLKKDIAFRMLGILRSSDRTGKEMTYSGRLTRKRQPKFLDEGQYPQLYQRI